MSATHKIKLLKGEEPFTNNGVPINLTIQDFWQYESSNIYNLQPRIAEFLVGKALGLEAPTNSQYWTLWDIDYVPKWLDGKMVRVEVKGTSYYHPWSENRVSELRSFDIEPTNLGYETEDGKQMGRNCDIYVFCLNRGFTREESNPMDVSNWEFYVAATSYLNEVVSPTQKTISLGKLRKLKGVKLVPYENLKEEIDQLILSGAAKAHNYSDDGETFLFGVKAEKTR